MADPAATVDYPGDDRHALTHRTHGDIEIIEAPQDVDVYSANDLRVLIADLINREARYRLVVDLEHTEFLDATGLGVLVGALRKTRAVDGALAVACSRPRILRLIELTGLAKVLDVYETVDDALYALGTDRPNGGGQ